MSDGNITHQQSPKKVNTSLGASPEKQRTRTASSTSSNCSSPPGPIRLFKRSFYATFDEEEENENQSNNISMTSSLNKLDLKTSGKTKKSYSRLPFMKRARLSESRVVDQSDMSQPELPVDSTDNTTPLSALPITSLMRNVR